MRTQGNSRSEFAQGVGRTAGDRRDGLFWTVPLGHSRRRPTRATCATWGNGVPAAARSTPATRRARANAGRRFRSPTARLTRRARARPRTAGPRPPVASCRWCSLSSSALKRGNSWSSSRRTHTSRTRACCAGEGKTRSGWTAYTPQRWRSVGGKVREKTQATVKRPVLGKLLQLKIVLRHLRPPVWRRLLAWRRVCPLRHRSRTRRALRRGLLSSPTAQAPRPALDLRVRLRRPLDA